MKQLDQDRAYYKASKRVEQLRAFYTHLVVYIVINSAITIFKLLRNFKNGETFSEAFFDLGTFFIWGAWGIAIALHAFSIFGIPKLLGRNWEENKIKEFMEQEQQSERWD